MTQHGRGVSMIGIPLGDDGALVKAKLLRGSGGSFEKFGQHTPTS
jgi:hypothetical protein